MWFVLVMLKCIYSLDALHPEGSSGEGPKVPLLPEILEPIAIENALWGFVEVMGIYIMINFY